MKQNAKRPQTPLCYQSSLKSIPLANITNYPAKKGKTTAETKYKMWYNTPYVSAASWAIINGKTGKQLFGKKSTDRKEIASLTKIMTCYTAIKISRKFDLPIDEIYISVPRFAAGFEGTTAGLVEDDMLKIRDMFYAMMLPSGNDAALCIANYFGNVLYKYKIGLQPYSNTSSKDAIKLFIKEMNENAKLLRLTHTTYANPHGLANINNKSTAEDVGKLAAQAMQLDLFRSIVGTKSYKCIGYDRNCKKKTFCWENTQKLLWQGYTGVKTGITPNAGPCLCSYIEKNGHCLIIVLLNSKSMETRWDETINLTNWGLACIGSNKENL